MSNDWSHKVRAILKKYCPPHKARGIHDFILATKSSVWIILLNIVLSVHPCLPQSMTTSLQGFWIYDSFELSQVLVRTSYKNVKSNLMCEGLNMFKFIV